MFLCPVTFSALVSAGGAAPATSSEQALLELQFDGPIPPWALSDLRRCPPRPIAVAVLADDALSQWQALAWSTLKREQQRLVHLRARRDGPRMQGSLRQWSLQECVAARRAWRVLAAETARRSRVRDAHVRTLSALNKLLGV